MRGVERLPGLTRLEVDDDGSRRIAATLVRLEHEMWASFDDERLRSVGYQYNGKRFDIVMLQPFAPWRDLGFAMSPVDMQTDEGLRTLKKHVGVLIPQVLTAIAAGRRRERRMRRVVDAAGDVVTPVTAWRFDPLFEPLARSLGFEPRAPIALAPSAFEVEPTMGPRTRQVRVGKVMLEGLLHDDDRLEMIFAFDEGPIDTIGLSPSTTDIHLRGAPPETVAIALMRRPLSHLISIDGLEPSTLSRRIEHIDADRERDTMHVGAHARRFVRIDAYEAEAAT